MKTYADQIIEDMRENPDDWVQGQYEMTNKKISISLWTANGRSPLRVSSGKGKIYGLWDKWRLWRAIKRLNRYRQIERQAHCYTEPDEYSIF